MPSHGTAHATIGHAVKSDGSLVTAVEWRANRLVDAAAKSAALGSRAPVRTRNTLRQALAAAEYGAALAGATTRAANNHKVAMLTPHGHITMVDMEGANVMAAK